MVLVGLRSDTGQNYPVFLLGWYFYNDLLWCLLLTGCLRLTSTSTRQLKRQFYKTQPSVSTIPRFPIIGFLEILKYKETHKQWKLKEIILQNKMCLVTVCFHTLHIVRLNKYGHARQCPGYTIPISYVCLKSYVLFIHINVRQDDRFEQWASPQVCSMSDQ